MNSFARKIGGHEFQNVVAALAINQVAWWLLLFTDRVQFPEDLLLFTVEMVVLGILLTAYLLKGGDHA